MATTEGSWGNCVPPAISHSSLSPSKLDDDCAEACSWRTMSQRRRITATPPTKIRLTRRLWLGCCCFLPWRGINDGKLGEAGGDLESRPRRSRLGDRKAPEVAERTGGVSWL